MVRTKLVTLGLTVAILGASPVALAQGNSNAHNKITICHATGSKTNPFVKISPNANGVVHGHIEHQDNRDVIPAFSHNDHGTTKSFGGQNLNNQEQDNDCMTNEGGNGEQPGGGQVQGVSTAVITQTAQVNNAPVGGVGAGAGGGSRSNTTAFTGLVSSLASLGGGAFWLSKRGFKKSE